MDAVAALSPEPDFLSEFPAIDDSGCLEIAPAAGPLDDVLASGDEPLIVAMADRCRQLWAAALLLYLEDCWQACQRSRRGRGDAFCYAWEALDDLSGSQTILARLCEPLGLDPAVVAERVLADMTVPG